MKGKTIKIGFIIMLMLVTLTMAGAEIIKTGSYEKEISKEVADLIPKDLASYEKDITDTYIESKQSKLDAKTRDDYNTWIRMLSNLNDPVKMQLLMDDWEAVFDLDEEPSKLEIVEGVK